MFRRFGVLWLFIRKKDVYSPQEYKAVIKQAYYKYFVEVIDVWVIPDYDFFVQPYMNKDFGQYC